MWCNKCCLLNYNKQKKSFEKQIMNKTTTHAMLQILLKKHEVVNNDILERNQQNLYTDF